MRKGRDGGKTGKKKREKTDENSGHYVIAISRPPERRPPERRTLAPKTGKKRLKKIVATTSFASSLPPEGHRPNDDSWNAARSGQLLTNVRSYSMFKSMQNC